MNEIEVKPVFYVADYSEMKVKEMTEPEFVDTYCNAGREPVKYSIERKGTAGRFFVVSEIAGEFEYSPLFTFYEDAERWIEILKRQRAWNSPAAAIMETYEEARAALAGYTAGTR